MIDKKLLQERESESAWSTFTQRLEASASKAKNSAEVPLPATTVCASHEASSTTPLYEPQPLFVLHMRPRNLNPKP